MAPRLDCSKARLEVKVWIIGSKETRLDNSANEKYQKIGKAIEAVALTDVKADSLASVASGFLKFYNSYPIEARSKITVKLDVERVTLGKKTPVAWYQDFILTTTLDYLASKASTASKLAEVMAKFNAVANPTSKLERSTLDDSTASRANPIEAEVEYTASDFTF